MHRKPYWFKRRSYGYGWTPISWQGWMVIGVFLVGLLIAVVLVENLLETERDQGLAIFLFTILWIPIFIYISAKKGPKARWQWGGKAINSPDEDDPTDP